MTGVDQERPASARGPGAASGLLHTPWHQGPGLEDFPEEEWQARCCWDQSRPLCHVAEAPWLIFNQCCPHAGAELIKHSLPHGKGKGASSWRAISISTPPPRFPLHLLPRLQAFLLAVHQLARRSQEEMPRPEASYQGPSLCTPRARGACWASGSGYLNLSVFFFIPQRFRWLIW